MDYGKYKNALEKAKVRYNEIKGTNCSEEKFLLDLFPELKENKDRIRQGLIKALSSIGKRNWGGIDVFESIAWLEKQKVTDKEIIFRALPGTDIIAAAKQALEKIEIGKEVILSFNDIYIPVNGKTVAEICNEYFAWTEKQNKNNSENYCEDCINRKGCINCENGNLKETISLDSCEKQDEQDFSHNVEDEIRNELYDFIYITTFQPKDLKKKERFLDWIEKQNTSINVDSILEKVGVKPAYIDGNSWCILHGDNIQNGICGFGYTKEEALIEFLKDLLEKQSQKSIWSEEDERLRNSCIKHIEEELEEIRKDKFGHSEIISDLKESCRERINWLKSLKKDWLEKQCDNSSKWQKNTADNKPAINHSVLMKTTQGIAEGYFAGNLWFQFRWSSNIKDSDVLAWMELSDLNEQDEQEPKEEIKTTAYDTSDSDVIEYVYILDYSTGRVIVAKHNLQESIEDLFKKLGLKESQCHYMVSSDVLSIEYINF